MTSFRKKKEHTLQKKNCKGNSGYWPSGPLPTSDSCRTRLEYVLIHLNGIRFLWRRVKNIIDQRVLKAPVLSRYCRSKLSIGQCRGGRHTGHGCRQESGATRKRDQESVCSSRKNPAARKASMLIAPGRSRRMNALSRFSTISTTVEGNWPSGKGPSR
jgi:hypothetical protein